MDVNLELSKYIPLVNMLADTFGRNCEVILHDLTIPTASVVFVVNNHVTGRLVGQSFDHLIRDVLLSKEFGKDYRANYEFVLYDGRVIKSSTCLLRNANNKVIGAICINYDISNMVRFNNDLSDFLNITRDMSYESEKAQNKNDSSEIDIDEINISEVISDLIERVFEQKKSKKMGKKERIEMIHFLNEKGIFLVKGSIEKVAEKMAISPVTVYSYLDVIKK